MDFTKKLLFAIGLLNLGNLTYAMEKVAPASEIKENKILILPLAEVLKERLQSHGLKDYLENTDIIKQLGSKRMYPTDVIMAVNLSLYDYIKRLGNPAMDIVMEMREEEIVRAILQESPEAIAELEECGLLTRTNVQKMDTSKATMVTLPSAKVLSERLLGDSYFIKTTCIDQTLGGQILSAIDVVQAIENAFTVYDQRVGNPMFSGLMRMRKGAIIRHILQDSKEAIAELENCGVLKKLN